MDSRRSELIDRLSARGWRVIHREQDALEWWADEIWTLESEWSPQGFTIFLTWLVDPQWSRGERPGDKVSEIGVSLQRPTLAEQAVDAGLNMPIKHWPRGVAEFLESLDALRQR